MKFSEMTYTRPDPAASKQRLSALTAELKAAKSYEDCLLYTSPSPRDA